MARIAAQEAQTNVVVDVYPIAQAKPQHGRVEIMRALGVLHGQQHMAQTQNTQIAGVAHWLLFDFEAV